MAMTDEMEHVYILNLLRIMSSNPGLVTYGSSDEFFESSVAEVEARNWVGKLYWSHQQVSYVMNAQLNCRKTPDCR
nr:hypothetical protein CFP56_36894 [Quercus suber]